MAYSDVIPSSIVLKIVEEARQAKRNAEICDYSWLPAGQCAHCLGHVPDWDEPKRKVNIND